MEDLDQIVVGFFDHHKYQEMTELIEVSHNNQVIMDIFAKVIDYECKKRKYGLYRFTQELDLSDKAQDALQEYLRFANYRDL